MTPLREAEIRMGWQPELEELRERERLARELGGADKIKRQHDAGKLTIRERIGGLVDEASFHEIGAIAGRAQYDADGRLADVLAAPADDDACAFARERERARLADAGRSARDQGHAALEFRIHQFG